PSNLTAEQYVQEGNRHLDEKQFDKAVDSYKQAIRLNPDLADAQFGLGTAYASMDRISDALEPLRTAVRLAPDNARAHLNLGRVLAQLRHFDEALQEMNESK